MQKIKETIHLDGNTIWRRCAMPDSKRLLNVNGVLERHEGVRH
ncbi:hypothetical protein XNW1_4240057 [Xenorhabdus nematophila str. Websteri]|nr:hypothetical protein XNW1_4240057 [Xenorhabdus nematophila str. Websteri]